MKKIGRSNQIRFDTPASLAPSFQRSLAAANLSPHTISAYTTAVSQFDLFLASQGIPADVQQIAREHIEAFIANLLATKSAGTANTRYRGLQQFFRWLVEDDVIDIHRWSV